MKRLNQLIRQSERPFVVVSFFKLDHKGCQAQLPELVDIQKSEEGKANVLLVALDADSKTDEEVKAYAGKIGADFAMYTQSEGSADFILSHWPDWDGEFPVSCIFRNSGDTVELIKGLPDAAEIMLIVNRHQKLGSI